MKIAIIPARKGSKRIINKNTKSLFNKPLISWTIEEVLNSKQFSHVFVSTDCEDIAEVALKYGAEVPFLRKESLSTDKASTEDVISNFMSNLKSTYQEMNIDTIGLFQPTSPLRTKEHIIEACELYNKKCASAVVSVCELEHPLELTNSLGKDLSMDGFIDKANIKRSQDYKKRYRLNGAIYLFDKQYINNLSDLYKKGTFAYVMDRTSSVDIDVEEDLLLAEFYIRNRDI